MAPWDLFTFNFICHAQICAVQYLTTCIGVHIPIPVMTNVGLYFKLPGLGSTSWSGFASYLWRRNLRQCHIITHLAVVAEFQNAAFPWDSDVLSQTHTSPPWERRRFALAFKSPICTIQYLTTSLDTRIPNQHHAPYPFTLLNYQVSDPHHVFDAQLFWRQNLKPSHSLELPSLKSDHKVFEWPLWCSRPESPPYHVWPFIFKLPVTDSRHRMVFRRIRRRIPNKAIIWSVGFFSYQIPDTHHQVFENRIVL